MSTPIDPRTAYINGTGCVSPWGLGLEPLWQAALAQRSCVQDGFAEIPSEISASAMTFLVQHRRFPGLTPGQQQQLQENLPLRWSLAAIWQSMDEAGWDELSAEDGFVFATTTGELPLWEKPLMEHYQGQEHPEQMYYIPVANLQYELRDILGHRGPFTLVASACTASTQAMGIADLWLRLGKVRRCLVGSTEKLCELTKNGFSSLGLISRGACRPFSFDRDGINLSEASAFMCLSGSRENSWAKVSGSGYSCDAGAMTAPDSAGRGCYRAMKQALAQAGLSGEHIDWVHAHGTGSQLNDLAESTAINALELADRTVLSSTKSVHGHALGASGVLEGLLCLKSLKEQMALGTAGTARVDENIFAPILLSNQKQPLRHILKNTLGFGGINSSIIFSRVGS